MKVCAELIRGTQIYKTDGSVRVCAWFYPQYHNVGKLTEQTMEEIWQGEKVKALFDRIASGDYSICNPNDCPFLASAGGKLDNVPMWEIDEIPERPTHLNLSYEKTCNYRCTVCAEAAEGNFDGHDTLTDENRKKIEKNLESTLPYLERIGANGAGEIMASKSTLELLSKWKPVNPEKVHVRIETNGSLFDEQHWKKIENLGQYPIFLVCTVMSFDERTYQILSGVKYPISRIENNLRFIKSLRDKGVINHFQITTVVQERNFRTLPQWFDRCVNEFGADSVRMRPYSPYGYARESEWVADVRANDHPYHKEYLEVMKDPVFQHPKFVDWGVLNGHENPSPFKRERKFRQQENKILKELFSNSAVLDKLENELLDGKKEVIVNGAGALGLAVTKALKDRGNVQVKSIIDYMQKGDFLDIPIFNPKCDCEQKDLPIIFTWLQTKWHDYDYIRGLGYTGKFIKLEEIFDFDKLFKEDCDCCK